MKYYSLFTKYYSLTILALMLTMCGTVRGYALDSDLERQTLSGIQGVNIVIEDMQPNIQKYAQRFELQKEQIRADVESTLKKAGVPVLTWDQWLKTPGKPFLYVNVNTHEYEKYWYAYDVKVELKQSVMLEINPSVKTIVGTWSMSMTGIANVGKLDTIKSGLNVLIGRFIEAYLSANPKRPKLNK